MYDVCVNFVEVNEDCDCVNFVTVSETVSETVSVISLVSSSECNSVRNRIDSCCKIETSKNSNMSIIVSFTV